MDSVKKPSTKPRYRGKGSVARRADAFRERIAAKLPTQRSLMDAKYMGPEMSNSLALSDYLGKFYSHLSVQETKHLICLSVEDSSHPDLAKYWDEIAGRDSDLGDSSDDGAQDIIICAFAASVYSSNRGVTPVSTPTLSSEVIKELQTDAVQQHSSCVLSPEKGEIFQEYLQELGPNVEASQEVVLDIGTSDDVAIYRLDSEDVSVMAGGRHFRGGLADFAVSYRVRLQHRVSRVHSRYGGLNVIDIHQSREASCDPLRISVPPSFDDRSSNTKKKSSKESLVLGPPSSLRLGVTMAFLYLSVGRVLLLYAYHSFIGVP